MQTPSKTTAVRILFATVLVSVLFLSSNTWQLGHAYTTISPPTPVSRLSLERGPMTALNVASRIYVINLPHRTRRRLDMERLRYSLGLDFTYVDGTEADGEAVYKIMRHIAAFRALTSPRKTNKPPPPPFGWPQEVETLVESESPLAMEGSDFWSSDTVDFPDPYAHEPLTCAYDNFTLEPYSPLTPPYRLLTKERLACWHSHWRVIRSIADGHDDVCVVLEDDVDMELDIRQRLLGVWDSLPSAWDIVFLGTLSRMRTRNAMFDCYAGHCWSDESKKPAIASYHSPNWNAAKFATSLHPSTSPKCTHAYALSKAGARRLAVYLRYPPFAYSRAIDQAISWLVESGKLRSYSIVPSVVIQRKVDNSSIFGGRGSSWRDNLTRGVYT